MPYPSLSWPEPPPEIPPPGRPGEQPEPTRPPVIPQVEVPQRADWATELLKRRLLVIFGPLDHAAATRAAALVMTLDAEGDEEIGIRIACEDAELTPSLMLAETIALTSAPVTVTATGVVAGAALAVVCAADRRVAAPRALFRMSEPRHSLSGTTGELVVGAEDLMRQVQRLHAWVARPSGKVSDEVAEDMRRGRVLDAADALAYGLVEEVLTDRR